MSERLRHEVERALPHVEVWSPDVSRHADPIVAGEPDAPCELIFHYLTNTESDRAAAKASWDMVESEFRRMEER